MRGNVVERSPIEDTSADTGYWRPANGVPGTYTETLEAITDTRNHMSPLRLPTPTASPTDSAHARFYREEWDSEAPYVWGKFPVEVGLFPTHPSELQFWDSNGIASEPENLDDAEARALATLAAVRFPRTGT